MGDVWVQLPDPLETSFQGHVLQHLSQNLQQRLVGLHHQVSRCGIYRETRDGFTWKGLEGSQNGWDRRLGHLPRGHPVSETTGSGAWGLRAGLLCHCRCSCGSSLSLSFAPPSCCVLHPVHLEYSCSLSPKACPHPSHTGTTCAGVVICEPESVASQAHGEFSAD